MGFARELKDFAEGFETGADIVDKSRKSRTEWEKVRPIKDSDIEGMPDEASGGGGKIQRVDGGNDGQASGGAQVQWNDADPYQKAFLETLAGPESGGQYDVIYGGGHFSDFKDHPRQDVRIESGPNKGKTSSAAGKYQFLGSTWDRIAKAYHIEDFSPANQDKAAWYLATEDYGSRTGRDLHADLKSGDPKLLAGIGKALSPTWTSLPSGIEQGTSEDAFITTFNKRLGEAPAETAVAETKPAEKKGIEEPEVQETGDTEEAVEQVADLSPMEVPEAPEQQIASWDEFANTDEGFEDQLARAQALQAGGQSPVRSQQAAPVMWAEEGGVIPEPQYFAAGGMEQPMADARQLGLSGGTWQTPAPVGGVAATGPRRVSMPVYTGPTFKAGERTPTQIKLDQSRANRAAADAKAKADAEAKAAAEAAKAAQQPAGLSRQQMMQLTRARMLGIPLAPGAWGKMTEQMTPQQYTDLRMQGYGGGMGGGMFGGGMFGQGPRRGGSREEGGMVYENFQEGGAVPEPGEDVNFARGGKVEDRDELFQRYLREESRAPGRGGGDSARDRAARRLSQSEGRASSTAYSPVNDSEMFTPKTPRGGGGGGKGPGGGKGVDKGKTSSTEKRFPGKEEDDRYIREQRTKDDRYLDPDLDISRNPYDRRGGAERTPPGRLSDEYVRPNAAKKGPFPRPHAQGNVGIKEKPRQKYPRPGLEPQFPASREPVVVEPRPLHTRTPGNVEYTRPGLEPQAPALREPAPERFAPEEEIIPGAWINGQFVPMNTTAAPGMGFAAGGAVPDEEDDVLTSQRDPGYTTSAPGARSPSSAMPQAERELPATAAAARRAAPVATPTGDDAEPARAQVRATPQLVSEVRKAVDGGVKFLTRHFNIGNEGAVPMPEDEATTEDGTQRFARGEGAATNEEIAGMDDKVDPNRELDEGKRQMARFAKTMRWYQSRGREDEAQAAAGSLLQYGAARFSKLGSMSQAAYQQYLNTGDPAHLQKTVQFLEKAYEMVPDGAEVTVQINDQTGKLEVLHEDENGEEEFIEVDPNDLPGVIRGVQDKSMYWNSIFRLADPEGAKSKDIEARGVREDERREAADIRKEGRTEEYKIAGEGREAERDKEVAAAEAAAKEAEHARGLTEEKDKERRAAKEHDRQALLAAGIARAQEEFKGRDDINMGIISPILAEVSAATAAEDQEATDAALSKLWDSLPDDEKRTKIFADLTGGQNFTSFTYTPPAANEMARPEGVPPEAQQVRGKKSGRTYWAIPDGQGGWQEVELEGAG